MKRFRLHWMLLLALFAPLLAGCMGLPVGDRTTIPTKPPGSKDPSPSILSEIMISPSSVPANKVAIVSVGYYMGETSPDGTHVVTCLYPTEGGDSETFTKWETTGKNQVDVNAFEVLVKKPGSYHITCQIDAESTKVVTFQVFEDLKSDLQAEVKEVSAGPSGSSDENFYVLVSYIYGSAAAGNVICSYPAEDGSPVQQSFPITRPDPVEEYAGTTNQFQFFITVKKAGQYEALCHAEPGNRVARTMFVVKEKARAEVRSVQVVPAGGQKFRVEVTTSYGSAASGKVICAYPGEDGARTQREIPFTRPEPAAQTGGTNRQDSFEITVNKAGTYQAGCRTDPGGMEQSARFTVKERPVLAINTLLNELPQNSGNQLTYTTQVALKYNPKDNSVKGTLAGLSGGQTTSSCKDSSGAVIEEAVMDYDYNYLMEVKDTLLPGQEVKIQAQPAVHLRITVLRDYNTCDPVFGGNSSSDMNFTWDGWLTILVAEDGSYTLTTRWNDSSGSSWAGSATGTAVESAE